MTESDRARHRCVLCDGQANVGEIVATLANNTKRRRTRSSATRMLLASLAELCEKHLFVVPMNLRPYALLAEITYRCPLHCPYCSNPATYPAGDELTTAEWRRVIDEAAALGVLQAGFSGGEPLARRDLAELIAHTRATGMYTNLITSGVGLDEKRARELRDAGLDSVQISFQSDRGELADAIAGVRAHEKKSKPPVSRAKSVSRSARMSFCIGKTSGGCRRSSRSSRRSARRGSSSQTYSITAGRF